MRPRRKIIATQRAREQLCRWSTVHSTILIGLIPVEVDKRIEVFLAVVAHRVIGGP